ncbi:MAG: signal peptidase II [Erysipelotrichaceae bacterium]|nr:signal peptidase II [Erysipelotrichaceae bacterium]
MIFADQFSKFFIVRHFALGQKVSVIPGFFNLTNVRNTGAGFSILTDQTAFLSAVSVIAVIALIYLLRKEKDLFTRISYLMIIAGALGNLIDRFRLGYVVDFLDFYIFRYDFPVFNIADSFITIGCFLLILINIKESRHA